MLERLFHLKKYGTTVGTEVIAGLTTFLAMAYIILVNPGILSQSGMEWGAVFLATILSAVIGTLIMGFVANVPYAVAPGMGLNAFFVYTVCFTLGFTWQEALTMVFLCGLFNLFITVTKIRKQIINAIPTSLQHAISGGIGVFIAYLGILNVGLVNFESGIPALSPLNQPSYWVFFIGLLLIVALYLLRVKGAILIGIIAAALIGIPLGVTTTADTITFTEACKALPDVFGVIFTAEGFGSLFSDLSRLPFVLLTIFSFAMSDTFDTIGSFIGTGRRSGILNEAALREANACTGFKTRIDRALLVDATATSIGAILGTTNTTTYVESASGIGVGGRTGLVNVVVALCFLISAFLSPFISAIPYAATAPALIVVGVMLMSSFREVDWSDFAEAVPAFFVGIFMSLCYSISYGIAFGVIFYCLIQVLKKQSKTINLFLWGTAILFLLNFILLAIL